MPQLRIIGSLTLAFLLLYSCRKPENVPSDSPYSFNLPAYFPALPIPANNPTTVNGVALGRRLFYDPILSSNGKIACASCHRPEFSFAENLRFSKGVNDSMGHVNTSSLVNVAWYGRFFWDGRAKSLEEQVPEPIQNPIEMHENLEHVLGKLRADSQYPALFQLAFGDKNITTERLSKAIAQFERTLISAGKSKFDAFLATEDPGVFSKEEFEGYKLFFSETGDCFHCHGGALGTSTKFENNGLEAAINGTGIGKVLHNPDSDGMFKVPSLRNVVFSAPYMHDGRFNTLEEVIEHYNSGLQDSRTLHPKLKIKVNEGGLNLSETQKKQLLAFIKTFTDSNYRNESSVKSPF